MDKLLAETDADDSFAYWTYKDLLRRRIVGSRTDLFRKQQLFGFPRPVVLTGGTGANAIYKVSEVKAWLLKREALAARNNAPELKENSPPRGRPRKNPNPEGSIAAE